MFEQVIVSIELTLTGSKRQFYRDNDLFFGAVAEGDQWGADAFNGSLTHGVGDPGLYDGYATA